MYESVFCLLLLENFEPREKLIKGCFTFPRLYISWKNDGLLWLNGPRPNMPYIPSFSPLTSEIAMNLKGFRHDV